MPTVSPWAISSRVMIWAAEPLPLVPVMWMTGQARCGSPIADSSRSIRSVDGELRCPVVS